MPTFRELSQSSASKGGMEKTVEFKYDEHVAVVMAAFRERTQTPHSSMPLVRKVEIIEERAESTSTTDETEETGEETEEEDADTSGWAMRLRRFFAANDAPEWVRKVSGGDYLRGTEQIEWSEAEGVMNMYTVNESHSHLITAEEFCVIRADPERPTTGTVKTLTVRARLRIRGWWTLGLSHVAEKFLLGRYTALVEQGKRIELDEIALWRSSGRADELLAAAAAKAERLLTAALSGASVKLLKQQQQRHHQQQHGGSSSPVSTLAGAGNGNGGGDGVDGGDSGASSPDSGALVGSGGGAENDDDVEAAAAGSFSSSDDVESQLNTTGSTDALLQAGLSEDQWLMMRYKYDQQRAVGLSPSNVDDATDQQGGAAEADEAAAAAAAAAAEEPELPDSPLHVPLLDERTVKEEEEEEDAESSDESFVSNDDFKSFYSASEAGTSASEYAYSAKDGFSRAASPVSWFSGDSPAASVGVSPSPPPGRGKRELKLGFKDFDLESTFDDASLGEEGDGDVDLDTLEREPEALLLVKSNEESQAKAAAAAKEEEKAGVGEDGVVVSSPLSSPTAAGGLSKSESSFKNREEPLKGRWRRLLVRVAVLGASVAIAHEKRNQLKPMQEQFRATVLGARRRSRERRAAKAAAVPPTAAAAAAADDAEVVAEDAEDDAEVVAPPPPAAVHAAALPKAADAPIEKAAAVEALPKPSKGSKMATMMKKKNKKA